MENTEQIFNVSEIRMHHNYNVGPVLVNDIALIKLSKRVKYTHVIQPICLPPANEREAVGTKCSITGKSSFLVNFLGFKFLILSTKSHKFKYKTLLK